VGEIPFVGARRPLRLSGSRKIARDVDSPAAIGGEITRDVGFARFTERSPFCFQTELQSMVA